MPAMPNTPDLKTVLSIIIAVALLLLVLIFTSLNMKPAKQANFDASTTQPTLQSSLQSTPEKTLSVTSTLSTPVNDTPANHSPETDDDTALSEQLTLKKVEDKTIAKQRENTELRDRAEQLEQELQRKMQSLQDVN